MSGKIFGTVLNTEEITTSMIVLLQTLTDEEKGRSEENSPK